MAKFRPAKAKKSTPRVPQGGMACIILVIAGIVLVMLFLYAVMRGSGS